jgi:hypothetical protein
MVEQDWKTGLRDLIAEWDSGFLPRKKGGGWLEDKPGFPLNFKQFKDLIERAAQHHDIRQIRPGRWWKAIQRIDTRLKKVGIIACLDALVERATTIPPEPQLRITIAAFNTKQLWEREALECAERLLSQFSGRLSESVSKLKLAELHDPNQPKLQLVQRGQTDIPWPAISAAIRPFTSESFQSVLPPGTPEEAQAPLIAWAGLTDIAVCNQIWWQRHSNARQFALSISLLNNPAYNKRLEAIFPYIATNDHEAAQALKKDPTRRKKEYRQEKLWKETRQKRLSAQKMGQATQDAG